MSESRIIFLPTPQVRSRTSRRSGKVIYDSVIEDTAIHVRRVPSSRAPIEMTAAWDNGCFIAEVTWRYFDGTLWRSILDVNGCKIQSVEAFESQARAVSIIDWLDYPFRTERYSREQLQKLGSDSAKLAHEANTSADLYAESIIEVDEVLYKRTASPIWSMYGENEKGIDPTLRLTMLDYPGHSCGHQSCSADEFHIARDFLKFSGDRLGSQGYKILSNCDTDVSYRYERHARNFDLPNEHHASFRRTLELVESALRHLRIGEVPAEMLAAYLQLLDARNQIGLPVDHYEGELTIRIADTMKKYVEGARIIPKLQATLACCHIHILRELFEEQRSDFASLVAIT